MKSGYIPLGVPASVVAVLQYRKKLTGKTMVRQLEELVLGSAQPEELAGIKQEEKVEVVA